MRYEITDRFHRTENSPNVSIIDGTPVIIRIYPEGSNVYKLFVAMIQTAYKMGGVPGLGGLATLREPDVISEKEAKRLIDYKERRGFLDGWKGGPDTRMPEELHVDNHRGRAMKLYVSKNNSEEISYDMNAYAFESYVGSAETLIKEAEKLANLI